MLGHFPLTSKHQTSCQMQANTTEGNLQYKLKYHQKLFVSGPHSALVESKKQHKVSGLQLKAKKGLLRHRKRLSRFCCCCFAFPFLSKAYLGQGAG